MNLLSTKNRLILSYIIMAVILYLVFLLHLSSFHIRTWDESIYAVNAYEMLQDGNYLVPHNNGAIDHVHAKPLLAVWCEVLSIKIFGFNELAIRLPSALAGIISCLVVFFFIQKYFNGTQAWCSFLVLASSLGFAHFHTTRTGDTDALLTLLLLLSNIYLFKYLVDNENLNKNIFLYLLFLGLAFLTKSFASLLFIPAHIFILLFQKQFINLFRKRGFHIGTLTFLLLSVGYITTRERVDPGYIRSIVSTDFSRVTNAIDNHNEPFDFYFNNFMNYRFSIWIVFFVAGVILLLNKRKENSQTNTLTLWVLSLVFVFLVVISISSTKLEWYDMPLYPYLALIVGYAIFEFIDKFALPKSKTIFLTLLFSIPIYYSIKQSYDNSMTAGENQNERISDYLFNNEKKGFDFNNWNVADTTFNGPLLFYKYKLKDKKQTLTIIKPKDIKEMTKVITSDISAKKYIKEKFNYSVVDTFYEVTVFDIKNIK